jgi:tetratricopeptide (TPR) repeat protein
MSNRITYDRILGTGSLEARPGLVLPTALIALFILAGAVLLAWNFAAPESLARTHGRLFGKPLEVRGLELEYGRKPVTLGVWQHFEVNPSVPLRLTRLDTNRWRNYDLRLFSPDFDVKAITGRADSLLDLMGEDYFLEPRDFLIEVSEGAEVRAGFILTAVFSSIDWSVRGDAAVELERKIGYYRKALDLEPDSEVLFGKLLQALGEAGRKAEQAELLEFRLEEDPQGPQAGTHLNGLLSLYRDLEDKDKEILALERLLALAEADGAPLEGLKSSLATLYRDSEPLKAAGIYEELLGSATPDHGRAYLSALIGIYRQEGQAALEIAAWEGLLGIVVPHEAPAVWAELVALREKISDGPGQRTAWAGLAESLPAGQEKANAYKRLGYLWYLEGDSSQAEEAYGKALANDRSDQSLYLNLARLALAKEDRDGYRENLRKALDLGSEPELALELARAYSQDDMADLAVHLWLGLAEAAGEDPETSQAREEARARLLDALRPQDGGLSENFEERLYQFSGQAVEFYNLGVAHFKAKDWDPAIKAFSRALELEGGQDLVGDVRAYLMATYKEKGLVKEMLGQAMLLYKARPAGKESRDLVVAHLEADKNWKALAEAAVQWTAWQPGDPDNWRFLALGQKNSGQEAEAARSLLKVAELEPAKASGWLMAAEALDKTGDSEAAKLAYQKVVELEPDNEKAESALLRMALESLPNSGNSGGR